MVMITTTTYFSNNVMIRHHARLSRVLMLMDHPHAIVPSDADLIEIHSPSQVILVPDHIIFNLNGHSYRALRSPPSGPFMLAMTGSVRIAARSLPSPTPLLTISRLYPRVVYPLGKTR